MDNMEKMVQQILAQINANAKANQEEMLVEMKATADADRKQGKAEQEKMAANQEEFLARMDVAVGE
jgi:hypothetical protein